MLDMIRMASPVLNHFIWLLTYQCVSKHDTMQYVTIADNITTTTMPFQGHAKVIHLISNMHGIWLIAYMCDTCSIPFSGTRNSFPCTKSWLDAIWDHNWTFKHHLIAISRSFKVHPYMLDMIHMARPVLNHFIWLLTYQRVSKHDIMQYVTIAHNIKTTITAFQGHVKVIHSYQSCMAYD